MQYFFLVLMQHLLLSYYLSSYQIAFHTCQEPLLNSSSGKCVNESDQFDVHTCLDGLDHGVCEACGIVVLENEVPDGNTITDDVPLEPPLITGDLIVEKVIGPDWSSIDSEKEIDQFLYGPVSLKFSIQYEGLSST